MWFKGYVALLQSLSACKFCLHKYETTWLWNNRASSVLNTLLLRTSTQEEHLSQFCNCHKYSLIVILCVFLALLKCSWVTCKAFQIKFINIFFYMYINVKNNVKKSKLSYKVSQNNMSQHIWCLSCLMDLLLYWFIHGCSVTNYNTPRSKPSVKMVNV